MLQKFQNGTERTNGKSKLKIPSGFMLKTHCHTLSHTVTPTKE